MKIDRNLGSEKFFKDVKEGEIFSVDINIYIKIESIFDRDDYIGDVSEYNFVNLEDGICGYFDDETIVNSLPNAVLKIS